MVLGHDIDGRSGDVLGDHVSESSAGAGTVTAKLVNAVQTFAQADRRLAVEFDQWDAEPFVINTPRDPK